MRPAYVRVQFGNSGDLQGLSFILSPVPFVWHYGDILYPAKSEQRKADSYEEVCSILMNEFHIPESLIPPARYFKPTRTEKQSYSADAYRTVPEGEGEPKWRMEARQAIIALLEDDETLFEEGRVSINDRVCYSREELQEELENVAEQASGRKSIEGAAYQPDYDVLVKEILNGYSELLANVGLPVKRRRAR